MVRIMVGTLVHVGLGKHPPEVIRDMLLARDRAAAGPTAPAHGLYLQWIRFKPLDQIVAEAEVEKALAAERAAARAAQAADAPALASAMTTAVAVQGDAAGADGEGGNDDSSSDA